MMSLSTDVFTDSRKTVRPLPMIEDAVLMEHVNTGMMTCEGIPRVINNLYFITPNFFEVFSYKLLEGDKSSVLDAPEKAVISERLAKQLFGEESPVGKEINLSGRRIADQTVFISGVFENFPETSHFHTDFIAHRSENDKNTWTYVYLLPDKQTDINELRQALTERLDEINKDNPRKATPYIMPLTDIHLRSNLQRELEPNGNINYLYLVAGANVLLLLIVLFNLWLNAGLMFASSRKYYQLLRLHGASSSVVLADECRLGLLLGGASILLGGAIGCFLLPRLHLSGMLTFAEASVLCLAFLCLVVAVSILPAVANMASTLFLNGANDLRPLRFSLSNVRYMLIAQYGLVMFIVIVGIGISKQIDLIKTSQVGGKDKAILVMKEQPDAVKERYDLFKAELLKYPGIEAVTAAMQLPGTAIRDRLYVWKEGESPDDGRILPLLVVGDDFLPFFSITPLAGAGFKHTPHTYREEEKMRYDFSEEKPTSQKLTEEYVINRKAMNILGFESP
jgi:putative ABC transport system permease protein